MSDAPNPPGGPPPPLLRGALYARVSHPDQAARDLSIPAQLRDGREYLYRAGAVALHEFTDPAFTRMTMDRPGLQALLALARRGADAKGGAVVEKGRVVRNAEFDTLVVWKLDRLSGEELDGLLIKAELAKCGVRIRSVTEPFVGGGTPYDEMFETFARGYAKLEVAQVRMRVHLTLRTNATTPQIGRQNGMPPYGYRWREAPRQARRDADGSRAEGGRPSDGGKRRARLYDGWEDDPDTALYVQSLFAAFDAGGLLFTDLCRDLNARGVPHPGAAGKWQGRARAGSGWYPQTVRRILTDRRYLGEIHYQGAWYPGSHPPLVAEDLFRRVLGRIAARTPGRSERSDAIFSGGLLLCPLCFSQGRRSVLYAVGARGPGGAATYAYRCSTSFMAKRRRRLGQDADAAPAVCPGFQVSEAKMSEAVTRYLAEIAALCAPGDGGPAPAPPARAGAHLAAERALLGRELAGLPGKRRSYQEQVARGLMDMDDLAAHVQSLAARKGFLEARIAEIGDAPESPQAMNGPAARDLLALLADPDAPALTKRDALRLEFDQIMPTADKGDVEVFRQAAP